MDAKEMASDLVKALKFGDIKTALQAFHPEDRAEQEEEIREGLEGILEDLPDGDPTFEWSQTNGGSPTLDLANSKAEWGMGWECCFRDGKWWLS